MGTFEEQTLNKENNAENATVSTVENDEPQKLAYPKRIFLIVGNEFCERFNYYGMTAILVIYLKNKLGFSENDATVLYHAFVMMAFLNCNLGAILSDVWLGKFRTILYFSILYVMGSVAVAIGAIPSSWISPKIAIYIGLTLIALGSGGIKTSVAAFGGDQFKLPEQRAELTRYFSIFYFTIQLGSVISTTITPILRADVHCFGDNNCYSLAFAVPAVLMIMSIFLFLIGKSSYTYMKTSSENMLMKMFKCIWNAIVVKRRDGKTKPRKNLLDYSIEKYGTQLVYDIRIMLKILTIYLPLPIFWALRMQTGSRFTFQAYAMNGDLAFYTIKPDQMQMVEAVFMLVFIPLCEVMIYPLLSKIGIKSPLHKLLIGGILAGVSFVVSACLQYWIDLMPINSICMLYQIPQYVILSLADTMVAVTGLSFSYEQAPLSMKSVVISFWTIPMALGNIILAFIAGLGLFESRIYEFLFFSGLMFCSMFVFAILANNYEKFIKAEHDKSST